MKAIFELSQYQGLSIYTVHNIAGQLVARVIFHSTEQRTQADVYDLLYTGQVLRQGSARGGGYDRRTAALSGLSIDGQKLTDHCEVRKDLPEGQAFWASGDESPAGYRFANYDKDRNGFRDCYRMSGLDYLKDVGYQVVQVF